jgi:hypothetical protein
MKQEYRDRAQKWLNEHRDHVVNRLLKADGDGIVEPSGSDAIRPELWKACHWRWFLQPAEEDIGCDYCRERNIDHCPKCDAEWN